MLIPNTDLYVMLVLIFAMVCLSSWANLQKAANKLRFELFYYDFAVGTLLLALIAALTLGVMGTDLSFDDNLAIASKRKMLMAVIGGGILNLSTILLFAASSVAGLSLAFPISFAMAVFVATFGAFVIKPQGNTAMVLGGCALLMAAIVFSALANGKFQKSLIAAKKRKNSTTGMAVALSCASGVVMVGAKPLFDMATAGDDGLGAYAVGFFLSIGVLFSTQLYNLYFMNLPLQGESLQIKNYFRLTPKQHGIGLLGGAVWMAGTIGLLVASVAPVAARPAAVPQMLLQNGAGLLAAVWGILLFKEYPEAAAPVRLRLLAMVVCFLGGLSVVALSR